MHLASDYPTDAPSVDRLLTHLSTVALSQTKHICDCGNEHKADDGDRTAADYADAEPIHITTNLYCP